MKTVLYKPYFINPLAYYVFPLLYDMQPKTDNFVELAVFTGIISVFDGTTTKQYTNTNKIDLSSLEGKRIRIELITNEGSTVLGEWLMPGASLPTLHESLVDAWSFSGYSNDNPPAGIRGVKGNELTPYNFAWSDSSGFGKYLTNFTDRTTWTYNLSSLSTTTNSFTYYGISAVQWFVFSNTLGTKKDIPPLRIRVSGLLEGQQLKYYYYKGGTSNNFTIDRDGEYIIPADMRTTKPTNNNTSGFNIVNKLVDNKITVTLIPEHEGALCFDGVDDYLANTNMPLLDDYTIICRRVIEDNVREQGVAGKSSAIGNGAFLFEYLYADNTGTYSFAANSLINLSKDGVSYQTKTSYNGSSIKFGNAVDSKVFCLGGVRPNDRVMKGSVYYFALYNKSLTVEEIEEEKLKLEQLWLSTVFSYSPKH